MSRIDKKRKRLKERIQFLENELSTSLSQKTSNSAEIDISEYMRKIQELNEELIKLK